MVNSLCLGGMMWLIVHRPELRREGVTEDDVVRMDSASWANPILLALALIISLTIPGVGMYSLLLLLLDPVVTAALARLHRGSTVAAE